MGKGLKQQKWSPEEDERLIRFVKEHKEGTWNWASVPEQTDGLVRSGKSCNTRWNDYLRSNDVRKTGSFTREEEETFIRLHQAYGNCWATIAKFLPGRSSYEIRKHWKRDLIKRVRYILNADGSSKVVIVPDERTAVNNKVKSWSDDSFASSSTVVGQELTFPMSPEWFGCDYRSILDNCLDETGTLNQQAYGGGSSIEVAGGLMENNSELAGLSPEQVCDDMPLLDLATSTHTGKASDEFDNTLVVSTPGLLYGDLGWNDAQFLDSSFGNLKEGEYLGPKEADLD
ncbi:hypothetical protein ACP4OV_023255 [Aristida adscensionis]